MSTNLKASSITFVVIIGLIMFFAGLDWLLKNHYKEVSIVGTATLIVLFVVFIIFLIFAEVKRHFD